MSDLSTVDLFETVVSVFFLLVSSADSSSESVSSDSELLSDSSSSSSSSSLVGFSTAAAADVCLLARKRLWNGFLGVSEPVDDNRFLGVDAPEPAGLSAGELLNFCFGSSDANGVPEFLTAEDDAAEDSDEVLESELADRVAFLWAATSEEPEDLLDTFPVPVFTAVLRCACCNELTDEPSSDSASLDATCELGNPLTAK
jgi:hypothetical protein